MAFDYISTSPRHDEIPDNMKYIFITKDYPKPTPKDGKKKCTKEQIKEYDNVMDKRKQMFDMLDSGHYDIGNSSVELRPFSENLYNIVDRESCYIYKIKPINSAKNYERYGSKDSYYVSKFDVEKRINNIYELIDDLSGTIYYADLFHYIFDRGHLKNEGYREHAIELFEYAKKNHPDKKIYLSDCILRVLHSYEHDGRYKKEEYIEEYAKYLLDNNMIELTKDWDNQEDTIKNLIRACWFNIAVDYIKAIPEDVRDIYISDIHKDETVMSVLRENSDKETVKNILSLLKVEDMCVILTVLTEGDWDDRTVEVKTFKDMNEVRSYVIREHKVPFEDACKNIDRWHGENDEWFKIK